jgi:S-DNA-T family DNA segregation ATPase FtsK/SpoIIIE
MLIAGATGSGKSVCMNSMLVSMVLRFSPADLKLILVDPKVVEFAVYRELPHLIAPVITEPKLVVPALRWVIAEMQWRYTILAKVGVRNLEGFNARTPENPPVVDADGNPIPAKLPYIVVIIDELADIMMTAKADVETSLARIAQKARAVGIHAIVATQRPSVNVITGVIKANFPCRIAFQVTSQVDARTILDGKGAEALLGRGDMLFRPPGAAKLERNQSSFVADPEIDKIVEHCAAQAEQKFEADVFRVPSVGGGEGGSGEGGDGESLSPEDEELIQKAIDVIVRDRRATTSYVQRRLGVGYNKAAIIMEVLEGRGIVGPQVGSAPREILITRDEARDEIGEVLDEIEDEEEARKG